MTDWSDLLDHLAQGPRENGTASLDATAQWLVQVLGQVGLDAHTVAWTAHPWRLRVVGVVACLAGLAYVWLMRRSRPAAALVIAVLVPAWIVLELDFGVPVVGWLHPVPQVHVLATVPAAQAPMQRLIVSAHYDTKTDLLDHVERAPITLLGLPLAALMIVAALAGLRWKLPRLSKAAQLAAVFNGVGQLLTQTGGVLVGHRSSGAVDDGASCAILVKLGQALHQQPLTHTEVELIFFSGEEIGIEGSRAWARQAFAHGVDLPTRVLNLDGAGSAPDLQVMKSELALVRSFFPDPGLLELVDRVHRERRGVPLYRPFYSAATDARAFLELGVPALSLSSDLPGHALPRGMHSSHDSRATVRVEALQSTLGLLDEVARTLDAHAL